MLRWIHVLIFKNLVWYKNYLKTIIMAGSRIEKFGSIYTRICGLLRSGALKVEDRPIWFDVYEAFPPKTAPIYEQKVPTGTVKNILYPEDFVRVKFYQTYGNPDIVDMSKETVKTTCQKFVEKYFELQKSGTPDEGIFEATAAAIKQQGIRLRSIEEIKRMKGEVDEGKMPVTASRISVKDVFGDVKNEDEDENIVLEDETSETTDPFKGS